jgi:UDP-glucose 4-epimerase
MGEPRAVVLGAAGFIGSHLVDRALAEGWRVVGIDNFMTGTRRNLEHLAGQPAFEFVEQDVCEPIDVPGPVDAVLDLASPASPIDYQKRPLETLRVGSVGVENALRLARAKGARFLFASTSEVYGDPLEHPQKESYWGNVNPVGPRSCYDEAKRFAEAITMTYRRHLGAATGIARIFNTYGPRMRLDDGRVVPAFVSQALRGEPITVFGDGRQTRSFCYVDDTVDGLWRLSRSEFADPVNIGNPHELTILEFAQAVQRIVGSRCPIEHRPLPEDDPRVRRPDIERARGHWGGSPGPTSRTACGAPPSGSAGGSARAEMARRALVTGGAGFIGSHVADLFLRAGWEVAVLDDLSRGRRENVPAGARFYPCDVRSAAAAEALDRERPQLLCHHAAQIDVRRSMADPRHDADVNVGGLLNLLQAAVKAGVEQVLFASSGGAYGETDVVPTPESHPLGPVSVYGASKAASELYLGVFRATHGLRFAALRYANVYGPRQDPLGEAGVVAIFCGRLLAGTPCTVNGDGRQTRDYVFVEDVARANLLAAEKGFQGALNVGTGVETDVLAIHRHLARAAGVVAAAVHAPAKLGEQRRSCIDPRAAGAAIGWRPEVPLDEGLGRTLEWFRARR